jgi:hypothetical protein
VKRIQKIAVLTLSILGMSLILGLVTFRQVRAAVSALVTVTNDATNPVPTSINNSYLNPIAVNFPTHLGVAPSKFVSLNCAQFSTSTYTVVLGGTGSAPLRIPHQVDQCSDWFLNNVGGTGQDGYSVPSGYDLIVTDIEVASSSGAGNGASLTVATSAGSGQSTVLEDAGTYDSNGAAVFREHMITGFSCTALPALILNVAETQSPIPGNSFSFNIQGYLVPAS